MFQALLDIDAAEFAADGWSQIGREELADDCEKIQEIKEGLERGVKEILVVSENVSQKLQFRKDLLTKLRVNYS